MFTRLLICLFFVLCGNRFCFSHDSPEIKTPLGRIRGTWETSTNGRRYAAFNGIPFAKPPIGELRFEEPEPIDPWSGVWDATTNYVCLQDASLLMGKIEGDEDCLYLNVYVPTEEINTQKNFDVLVSIHGGAFMLGSGHSMVNPALLMDLDIILVSINYRVGILGFLSTEDEVIPGNNGMRDQVMALKWVKENIASFGGNPNSVTITGLSAGGASVHLHYFSPLSKGLFIRGVSQSGTALDPWVIKEEPLESAKKLAGLVGCDDSSSQILKHCLKTRPALLLLEKLKLFYGYERTPISPFAPVIEKNSKTPFLPGDPYVLLNENRVLDVGWVTSTTADEGLLITAYYYGDLEKIDNNWPDIAHYLLDSNYTVPASKRIDVAKKIKDFYLGPGEHITKDNFNKLTQIFTDRLFAIGGELSAKLQSKANKSPVYYYFFNYGKGENSLLRILTKENVKGISHGDDMVYFYGAFSLSPLSETDKKLQNAFQHMLYSYVTTGKPSFDGSDKWQPTDASELTYLNITDPESIELQTIKSLAPIEFWKKLGISEYESLTIKDEL